MERNSIGDLLVRYLARPAEELESRTAINPLSR